MEVTGRGRWLLKIDEIPKRWPEKNYNEGTLRNLKHFVNSEIESVPRQLGYEKVLVKRKETSEI